MKKVYKDTFKRKVMIAALLVSATVLLFTSCKTLPKPAEAGNTLLVIPIGTEKSSDGDWFGKYKISIVDMNTNEIVKTKLLPVKKDGFTTVTGLNPGKYYISKDQFVFNKKSFTPLRSKAIRRIYFELAPNRISVLSHKFIYIMFDNSNGSRTMNRKWVLFKESEKKNLLESISEYKNYDLWSK